MKFLKKNAILLFIFLSFFVSSRDVLAQNAQLDFSLSNITFENTDPKNYTGTWKVSVVGQAEKVDLENNVDIVIADIANIQNRSVLCSYNLGDFKLGSVFRFGCPEKALSWIKYGGRYELYFLDQSKQEIISKRLTLPTDDIHKAIIQPNLTIHSVSPKQKGSKKYFEVKFDINTTKKEASGKPDRIEVLLYDQSDKKIGSLGAVAFSQAKNATLPQGTAILSSLGQVLPNKSYSLRFVNAQGSLVHPLYKIENAVFETKKTGGANLLGGSQIYSEEEQETIREVKEGGLVGSNHCGYGLSDPNNHMCGFNDFMYMVNKIISYIMVLILPIAALVFAYAGYLYLTSGGDVGKRNAAKRGMTNLAVGVLIILCAWVLVRAVLVQLGVTEEFFIFFQK